MGMFLECALALSILAGMFFAGYMVGRRKRAK